jgi:hypothetical protein
MTAILKSPKLTSLLEDRDKLKARAAQSRAEVWRMTQILSPQPNDSTVITVLDVKGEAARNKGVVFTGGIDEQAEAARKEDALKRTLAGEPLADSTSLKEKLEKEHRQWHAIEEAIEFRTREIEHERTALAIQYCKEQKPKHDDLLRRVCKTLWEFHAEWSELYKFKRHLIDHEIGLRGICLTLPDFLGAPNDKHSELADFLRAAKREGYVNSIPKEYQ